MKRVGIIFFFVVALVFSGAAQPAKALDNATVNLTCNSAYVALSGINFGAYFVSYVYNAETFALLGFSTVFYDPYSDPLLDVQYDFNQVPEGTPLLTILIAEDYIDFFFSFREEACESLPEGVPSGFQLRYITCSTGIYSSSGGELVPDEALLEGQTWYVDPTSEGGYNAVYISGSIAYVKSSCVGVPVS
ncbi:MAG: hypothetical protein HS103_12590 [Anaerolineales bacterium]|nr:hypothetical protein [Anaerolineales bacterium]